MSILWALKIKDVSLSSNCQLWKIRLIFTCRRKEKIAGKKGKNCRWVIIYVIDEILNVTNNFIFDAVLLLSSTDQLNHPYSESINLVCLLLLQIRRLYPGTCCPSTKAYDIGPIHFLVGHHRINAIHPGENVKGSIRKYFLWNN